MTGVNDLIGARERTEASIFTSVLHEVLRLLESGETGKAIALIHRLLDRQFPASESKAG